MLHNDGVMHALSCAVPCMQGPSRTGGCMIWHTTFVQPLVQPTRFVGWAWGPALVTHSPLGMCCWPYLSNPSYGPGMAMLRKNQMHGLHALAPTPLLLSCSTMLTSGIVVRLLRSYVASQRFIKPANSHQWIPLDPTPYPGSKSSQTLAKS